MGDRFLHPVPQEEDDDEVERTLRDIPPSHYTLCIDSFTSLLKLLVDSKSQSYESEAFEAGGYKWKLSIYPNGNKEKFGEGHISLYLVIVETDRLPLGWIVKVNFRLFVFDQIQDKYMVIQDTKGKVRRFHEMKTEWGFDKLLPLRSLKDASSGYLVGDKCIFGAEVFVLNSASRGESLTSFKNQPETHTWKIEKFSSLNIYYHYLDVFTIGGHKWKILLYPKGDTKGKNKSLSVFLTLVDDMKSHPYCGRIFVDLILRVLDQCHGHHKEAKGFVWFSSLQRNWGWSSLLPLTRLVDASKGFLVNDTLIIEVEVCIRSAVDSFLRKSDVEVPRAIQTLQDKAWREGKTPSTQAKVETVKPDQDKVQKKGVIREFLNQFFGRCLGFVGLWY